MKLRTRVVHTGKETDPFTGAAAVPVYQVSTYRQDDPVHPGKYEYARGDNPTREAVEHAVTVLEGGTAGAAFASGMAAISSVLMLFGPGDHLVVTEDVYGGTYRALTTLFRQWGLGSTFVDMADPDAVRAAIRPETKAIFVETPSNPILKVTDLARVAGIAKEARILSLIDNTFMTPYLQRPIGFGFDVVMHSATKFLGGHSDLLAGVVVVAGEELGERVRFVQRAFGAILGPQDSFLLHRGIKTLSARMEAQQRSALRVAERLAETPGIEKVFYPGLPGHPGREIHARQADGPGAVVSFELADSETAIRFLKAVELPLVAVSLGGVESILSYPATMSHASMPREERLKRGISDSLVRLSVGLEDPDDLLDDLLQALDRAKKPRGRNRR
jgi:cystathionine beta-lyase